MTVAGRLVLRTDHCEGGIGIAEAGDPDLGSLADLPGTWKNEPELTGRGWNLIALPFATEPDPATGRALSYRLLLNQFNEVLKFSLVDRTCPTAASRSTGQQCSPIRR